MRVEDLAGGLAECRTEGGAFEVLFGGGRQHGSHRATFTCGVCSQALENLGVHLGAELDGGHVPHHRPRSGHVKIRHDNEAESFLQRRRRRTAPGTRLEVPAVRQVCRSASRPLEPLGLQRRRSRGGSCRGRRRRRPGCCPRGRAPGPTRAPASRRGRRSARAAAARPVEAGAHLPEPLQPEHVRRPLHALDLHRAEIGEGEVPLDHAGCIGHAALRVEQKSTSGRHTIAFRKARRSGRGGEKVDSPCRSDHLVVRLRWHRKAGWELRSPAARARIEAQGDRGFPGLAEALVYTGPRA
jgi:hypothetical protein